MKGERGKECSLTLTLCTLLSSMGMSSSSSFCCQKNRRASVKTVKNSDSIKAGKSKTKDRNEERGRGPLDPPGFRHTPRSLRVSSVSDHSLPN